MTLDEKIGQMVQVDMNGLKDKSNIQKYGLGSMLSGGDSDPADITAKGWKDACTEYQTWALKTRLRIPLLYGIDAVHGHNNVDGAVVFPQNIGLGATRDPSLVQKAARATAEEVSGTAMQWAFAPCIAVAQDERWGRTYESYGESTELVTQLGTAAVRGFQQHLPGGGYVLGCAKHFIGDGGTQNGVDQGNTVCDEATLRRLFVPPYAAAIKAGVGSIMVSYSSWNGKKMHGNKYLLTDVLKGELGFRGFLISDYAAIDQLSPNYKTDIEESINAGLDMIMIPNGPGQKNNYVEFITLLKELVNEGRVQLARVDDAVRRILAVKYDMGLFESPFGDPKLTQTVGSEAHRKVARQCVRESLVLLKNEHHVLPLSSKLPQLTVLGRGADDLGIQCGGWTITWQGKTGKVTSGGTTILEAIRKTVSPKTAVLYSSNATQLADAKVVLVVVGELPYAEMKGDRKDLSLAREDLQLIQAAKQSGAHVVTVVLSGRPLVLGPALDASDAIVAAWLPGTEGEGVVDVLFGAAKPKGKLPRTWPRTNEQLGMTASSPEAKDALFPYGYGLTY
ncbi:MAG TPA: glycoside hydrolase family 3 N-terminal domain-containing protein [Candidatus Dormibacteraeota bacterium]|nr:glycoside hydrolase family 3 N-terminal domain-containing protein [Candidatus Dormibacteraeota bacterium]